MLHGSGAEIYMYLFCVVVVSQHQILMIYLSAPSLKLVQRKLNTLYDGHLRWNQHAQLRVHPLEISIIVPIIG